MNAQPGKRDPSATSATNKRATVTSKCVVRDVMRSGTNLCMSISTVILLCAMAACGGSSDAATDDTQAVSVAGNSLGEAGTPITAGGSDATAEDSQPTWVAANLTVNSPTPSTSVQAPSSGGYVTVSNGHLMRNGKRLRQWGVNLQSGVFPTYSEIDLLIGRLGKLGFNAIRLWPTSGTFYKVDARGSVSPATALRGDGSALDRYDYLVAKASEAGMTVQMTMLHYLDLPTLRALNDPALSPWIQSARSDAELRLLIGIAPYVSDAYRALLKQHIARQLTRVNPYTQRTYANEPAVSAWELANEARFVDCALRATCIQSIPASAFAALSDRWQKSRLNTTGLPLPADLASFIASSHYSAYARFIADAFISASEDLRRHAHTVESTGTGIAQQPFIFNTGPIAPNAVAHYAYSRGDVFSPGVYKSPLSKTAGLNGSPWLPVSVSGNPPSYLNHIKVEGKPLVVYEASFFRPYDFRAEWGPMMAALALQQDWDGAFLYQYGHPSVIYSASGRPEGYGKLPLPDPSPVSPDAWKREYTYGFHHGGDPVAMASWSVASKLFTSVEETAPLSATWRFSLNAIFSNATGYPAGYFDAASNAAKSRAVAISFVDSDAQACAPCELNGSAPTTFSVSWPNSARQTLAVITPAGTAITGVLSGALGMLAEGISATVLEPGLGVAAVLRDVQSSGQPAVATLQVIGNAENSARSFDAKRVDFNSAAGAMRGLTSQGRGPLTHSGPKIEFKSDSALTFSTEAFTLEVVDAPRRGLTAILAASTNTFLVRATKAP